MKVFVFGAGASRGSQQRGLNANQIAPLTDQLFDSPYDQSVVEVLAPGDLEACRQGVSQAGPLEKWLTARWKAASQLSSPTSRRGEFAFFGRVTLYLRQVLQTVSDSYPNDGTDAYSKLLHRIKERDETVGLISFNYDTLLDRAVQDVFGSALRRLEDYNDIPLIKPHGSVNWFLRPRVDQCIQYEAVVDIASRNRLVTAQMFNAGALKIQYHYVVEPRHADLTKLQYIYQGCATPPGVAYAAATQYCTPFMLIPLTSKLYGSFEGYDATIVAPARQCFEKAQEVYLIGYRAADDMIYDWLGHAKPGVALHVVGIGEEAQKIQDQVLSRQTHLTSGHVLQTGFSDFAARYPLT